MSLLQSGLYSVLVRVINLITKGEYSTLTVLDLPLVFIYQETKGRRKVLASAEVNMKKYASGTPTQYDVTLKLKPLSVKVVEAKLKLNLSCVFLKEGKAT